MMNTFISGERQYDFVSKFNYVREAGTCGEQRAAETILQELKKENSDAQIRTEEFSFFAPQIKRSFFEVTAPYHKVYEACTFGFCANTDENGLEANFVYLENADDINMKQANGKIVMLNNYMSRTMLEKLVKAGALGFVSFSGTPIDTGKKRLPAAKNLSQSKTLAEIPGTCIHFVDAAEIVEKGALRVRMICEQTLVEKTSQNICARIEGSDKSDDILTVTAHYDSVPQGPGAYDNMAGCAIVMELFLYFCEHKPRRTIDFLFFGAEEKGLLGSRAYVKAHESELSHHLFNMNIDLAGQSLGGTVIGITGDSSICRQFEALAEKCGIGMTTRSSVWSSDSNTFAWKRVPSMTLNRDGYGMHTEYDTIDLISAWSLRRSALLLCTIADYLANEEVFPLCRQIPQEFLAQLDASFSAEK